MVNKAAVAKALKHARKSKGLTQEDFSDTSSRTYISTLERGLKSPTIDKIENLAKTLSLHPLSLITLCYMFDKPSRSVNDLFTQIKKDLYDLKIDV